MNKRRTSLVFLMLLSIQVSCYAPEQTYPTSMRTPVYVQIPERLTRGTEYTITVSSLPRSICHAGVGFYNDDDKLTWEKLPTIDADENGDCSWVWEIPKSAKNGIGEFRGYVEQDGNKRNFYPATFCIESCE